MRTLQSEPAAARRHVLQRGLFRFASLLLLAAVGPVAAIESVDEYARRATAGDAVHALGVDLFGDQVSYYSGATTFSVTDVSLPGNAALPVAIGRTHTVGARGGY